MAMMPKNAELISNPLTLAPGFIIKNIYVLPGVPEIMKKMFVNLLQNIVKGRPKKTVTVRINLFESIIAEQLSNIQKNNPECSIGSYPYYKYVEKTGGVNIVVSSWTIEDLDKIVKQIKAMVSLLGGKSLIV